MRFYFFPDAHRTPLSIELPIFPRLDLKCILFHILNSHMYQNSHLLIMLMSSAAHFPIHVFLTKLNIYKDTQCAIIFAFEMLTVDLAKATKLAYMR